MRTATAILLAATVVLVAVSSRVFAAGPFTHLVSKILPEATTRSGPANRHPEVTANSALPPTTATATTTTTTSILPASSKTETTTTGNSNAPPRPKNYTPPYSSANRKEAAIGSDGAGILNDRGVLRPNAKLPNNVYAVSDIQGELGLFIDTIEHANLAIVEPSSVKPSSVKPSSVKPASAKSGGDCANWRINLRTHVEKNLKSSPKRSNLRKYDGDYLKHPLDRIKRFIEAEWANASDCIEWIGKEAVLVIAGNIFGGGPYSKGLVHFLMALREKARVAGGDVVIILGNHDMGVFVHDDAMASRIDLAQFATDEKKWMRFLELEYRSEYRTKGNPFELKSESTSSSAEDSNVKSTTKETLQRKNSKGKSKMRDNHSSMEDESTAQKDPSLPAEDKDKGKARDNSPSNEDEKDEKVVLTAKEYNELSALRRELKIRRRDWLLNNLQINPLIAAQIGPYLFAHAGLLTYDNVGPNVQALNAAAKQKFKELVDPTTKESKRTAIRKFFDEHIKHRQYSDKAIVKDFITNERIRISETTQGRAKKIELSESQNTELQTKAVEAVCAKVIAALLSNQAKRLIVGRTQTDTRKVKTSCGGKVIFINVGPEWSRSIPGYNRAYVHIVLGEPDKDASPSISVIEQEPMDLKPTDSTLSQSEKGGSTSRKLKWNDPEQLPPLGKDRELGWAEIDL